MSYEQDYMNKRSCPCGKGLIIEKSASNEWNQVKSSIYIDCAECESKYHIEHEYVLHGDHTVDIPVFVPNGETLCRHNSYNIFEIPFTEQLCRSFPLEVLKSSYEILNNSTTYSKIKDEATRKIIRNCKNVHNTMRIKTVKQYVLDAINIYKTLDVSYDLDTKRIEETKRKIISIKP